MKNLNKIITLTMLFFAGYAVSSSPYQKNIEYAFFEEPATPTGRQSRREPAELKAAPMPTHRYDPRAAYAFVDESPGVGYQEVTPEERARIKKREARKQRALRRRDNPEDIESYILKSEPLSLTPAVEELD